MMKKRICSLFLVLALCLGLVPHVALATEESENLALNAKIWGVSIAPPHENEAARYALDGNRDTKWCADSPIGWMVFETEKPIRPVGMMTYHGSYSSTETVQSNNRDYQLEVLNPAILTEADFLILKPEDQKDVMATPYYWMPVAEAADNQLPVRYDSVNMPEARRIFRFHVRQAGPDNVIRLYELELLSHTRTLESISLDPIVMFEKETRTLQPKFTPNYYVAPVTYSVADPEIAEVVDGNLLGKKVGTTTVTVTADENPKIQATATVTVRKEACRSFEDYVPLWWEKFEEETMPEGWTVEDRDGDGITWTLCSIGKVHHGKQSVYSRADENGKGITDNWLITPEFLVGHRYMFDLMASGSPSNPDPEKTLFYVLEEGKKPVLLGNTTQLIDGEDWYDLKASLDQYEGRRIRIAFVHQSDTPNAGLYVDCAALWRGDLAEYTAKVTFKVENGTWDGKNRADKVQKVQLKDGFGTLPKAAVPTGMQPDPGYYKGHWDYTPNVDENGVIGNIVYTYTFEKKPLPKDSAAVTFQVVNGTFVDTSDGRDTRQITVQLKNGKGTLSPEDVPEPFEMRPTAGYGFGAWDVVPNTKKDAITEDVTYQYIFTPAREHKNFAPIWWEGFEGTAMPEGWTVEDRDGDGSTWKISTDSVHHGKQSAVSASRSTAEGFVPDNWLITPEFLVGHQYAVDILYTVSEGGSSPELYMLQDGWEPVRINGTPSVVSSHAANGTGTWMNLKAYLSPYEGRRIRIAVVHNAGAPDVAVHVDCAALWREDLYQYTAKVVFQIENGTWDGRNNHEKVQEVLLTNGYGTLPAAAVPTGMQPNPGYEKGSWNKVPNVDENGVVGNIKYIYTFQEKTEAKDHATVTFRVVNGLFKKNREAVRQVQVPLENGKGTLPPEKVPGPSEIYPAAGYGLGAWDVVPDTGKNAITQDVTYQYVLIPVHKVEFNLLGCTWADGGKNTIYYEVPRQDDRPVYLTAEEVPAGMIPDEDHLPTGGNWYEGGNPLTLVDNILEYPITNSVSFSYCFEGKHAILLDRTLLLGGATLVAKVQRDLTELVCEDASVKIEHAFDNPDFAYYNVRIPHAPKTYTLKALDPANGNQEITAQVQVLEKSPFKDVKEDHWFSEAVMWAVEHGITDGFPDGSFQPNADCTRAQIVTFLWRSEGSPEPNTTQSPFTDVDSDDWFFRPVMWAVENGITDGFPDGSFRPQDPCTRAQAVTFLYRVYGYEPVGFEWKDLDSGFPDVKKEWYYDAVMWASYNEIVGGFPDGSFRPKDICTRAQIVILLYRLS